MDFIEKYVRALKELFNNIDSIKVLYESGSISHIVFGGDKEEFDISFVYDGRIDVYWNNECFIFDRHRNSLTSSDTYGEIVYEGDLSVMSDNDIAEMIIRLISVLKDSTFISKSEFDTGKRTLFGYDKIKDYIVQISRDDCHNKEWSFENIVLQCKSYYGPAVVTD